ncbi:two-component sensor histidine kinase [Saccharibacillus sp. O16]|nr:two-component sensor histidine kinase [Saccharibacillus sp. O16]
MSDKQIKWLILFMPTVVVGLWEYVRHQFLMPVLSMNAGNILTPILVFLVSITLLRRLFERLERMQRELEQSRAARANLEAREELARELHDGIAQSLFLLSVKTDRMERRAAEAGLGGELDAVRRTVHEVDRYVRQALANLREPAGAPSAAVPADEQRPAARPRHAAAGQAAAGEAAHRASPGGSSADQGAEAAGTAASPGGAAAGYAAEESMAARVGRLAEEAMIDVWVDWSLPDDALASREKAELLACIREAVINVRKHANAAHAQVTGAGDAAGWSVEIADDGRGFDGDPLAAVGRYGLKIMEDRAQEMGWQFSWESKPGRTSVRIGGGGGTL